MAIVNAKGDTVTEMSPGKSKGINIVTWNYYMKQPKVAKGKTFSFDGFVTPRLPAGKYTVKIKKGKEVFNHEIELIYDPESNISLASRKEKSGTVTRLYNMNESLAYDVFCLDSYLKYSDSIGNKKLSSKLSTLKKSMVITSGDNYVGSAEPQLREKLTSLLSRVEGNPSAPTKTETENLTQLIKRYESTKIELSKIIKKYRLSKRVNTMSKEEYLDSDM